MILRKSLPYLMVLCCAGFPISQAGGGGPVECDVSIDINALRGGSPWVECNGPGPCANKTITSKARIVKGTGPADQTLDDTTLTIQAFDGEAMVGEAMAPGLTLIVGRGGTGERMSVDVTECTTGTINFVATFTGTSSTNGTTCTADTTDRPLLKTCR